MTNYDTEIENALRYKILEKSDIYDFRMGPSMEELFSKFYNFCRENLNTYEEVDIKPNIFIYKEDLTLNASAKYDGNSFSILINKGLFGVCYNNFFENEQLNTYINKEFDVVNQFDNPISTLYFQIVIQFTYYHELAHLFQFSKKKEKGIMEEKELDSSDYSLERHYLEIDADTFAANMLEIHIVQYMDEHIGKTLNRKIIEEMSVIFGCCILNYIASISNSKKMYFKENSHPHPILRIFNIILVFTNTLSENLFFKNKLIELNGVDLFKKVFNFYKKLETEKIFNTNLTQNLDKESVYQEEIIEYLGELVERKNFPYDDYNSALDIYNEYIAYK